MRLGRSGVVRRVVLGGAVALVAASITTWSALSQESEQHRLIDGDPSWLAYLPPDTADLDLSIVGLNHENGTGSPTRRVDLMDSTHEVVVTLCFGRSVENATAACPGSAPLGVVETRDGMDLPAVVQLQPSADVDWLALLSSPTPQLDELSYVE